MNNMDNLEPWYRLGFITPHQFVDNVPYQFYRLAPPGMMLVMANLDLADYTEEAVEHELPLLWRPPRKKGMPAGKEQQIRLLQQRALKWLAAALRCPPSAQE